MPNALQQTRRTLLSICKAGSEHNLGICGTYEVADACRIVLRTWDGPRVRKQMGSRKAPADLFLMRIFLVNVMHLLSNLVVGPSSSQSLCQMPLDLVAILAAEKFSSVEGADVPSCGVQNYEGSINRVRSIAFCCSAGIVGGANSGQAKNRAIVVSSPYLRRAEFW